MMEEPTVFVVDDDASVCKALCLVINSVGLPAESFTSSQEFLDAYDCDRPGCLVLDVRMQGMSGLELQRKLLAEQCCIPVIFITGHGDVAMATSAIRHGAVDFIEKPFRDQVLLDRIQEAIERDRQIRESKAKVAEVMARVARLTPREHEVMKYLVNGDSSKAIAASLKISPKTVDLHRSNILRKMGVEYPTQLVRLAVEAGIT